PLELAAADPPPAPAEAELPTAGARAHFEPAHAPAVRVLPILELEKAVPVIVDPLAIASGFPADPEPLDDYPSASELLLANADPVALSELPAPATESELAVDTWPADELEPEPSERSRITLPPVRRRRWRPGGALLLGVVALGAAAVAGWYRYPAECERGWQQARSELALGWGAIEQQWLAARRGLGR
ncbi:MAG TPA: hypothetical protein VI197_29990, partial [Polyangiaceae bacterium]